MPTNQPPSPILSKQAQSNRTLTNNGSTREIAIVGGGICGLTVAVALEQRGLSPTVYEAASKYQPIGAGILLQTNALLVFDRLGIADRICDVGMQLDTGGLRSPNGSFMTQFDLNDVERREFGYGFVAIHRADLQRLLLDELDTDVRTGMACVDVDGTDPPVVHFANGTTITPDILVGADGIHSTVRNVVAPDVEPRQLGGVAYRTLVTLDLPAPYQTQGFEIWGDGTYTGGSPVDENRFYWFATAPEPLTDDYEATDTTVSALRTRLADYPDPIPAILDRLNPDDLIMTDLEDLPSLDVWSRDRVVLAGDAAHAMLPFAGQGAAQAIEDGLLLADAIASHERHDRAFATYESERKPRADRVRSESYRLGRLGTIQSSLGCGLRNFVIDTVPDAVLRHVRRRQAAGTSLPG
ncbi:FAD-dependent monooxygenase [Haloarcula nitratireducens]|uniref:FAD-dependent monooxygenase n=1 Tax=Haloarcula nitratireducens TaxID=2487749 RepID=A0AAW4PJI6_9EURY|nr:FAD-dependent monooxygenase [Halomicroarcula nitratireducens]MBX0297808.1 FAD-dependent monooxygenase [Halomicroarcula nitratireducens]